MNNGPSTSSIVAIGIALFAVLAAIFIYRNVVVFGIGGDLEVDQGTLFVDSSENRVGVKVKTPTYPLDVVGDVNSTAKFRELGFILIPVGTIVMWTGSVAPNGWVLCDGGSYPRLDGSGNISSPDLRGRFVLGQGQGTGLTNRVLDTVGGAETHTLSISEMPSHTHTGTTASDGLHSHTGTTDSNGIHNHTVTNTVQVTGVNTSDGLDSTANEIDNINTTTTTTSSAGAHTHTFTTGISGAHTHTFTTNSTGDSAPHNNMSPFYVLAYIMKV
jgi:microcystin-dependent protein